MHGIPGFSRISVANAISLPFITFLDGLTACAWCNLRTPGRGMKSWGKSPCGSRNIGQNADDVNYYPTKRATLRGVV